MFHLGAYIPNDLKIHHVVKAPGRATIAEFWTLIKSIHMSICRPAALNFHSVHRSKANAQTYMYRAHSA